MGFLLIATAAFCWAVDTLIRYPLIHSGIEAEYIVLVEHAFLSLFFLPFIPKVLRKLRSNGLKGWQSFLIIGALGSAIATISFTKAFSLINPNLVIFFQKFQPIVAISLAYFVLGEKVRKEFMLLTTLCFIGGLMMASEEVGLAVEYFSETISDSQRKLLTQNNFYGLICTFVAVISWGSCTVFGKKLSNLNFKEYEIMTGRFSIGLFFIIAITLITQGGSLAVVAAFEADIWLKLLVMVLVSGVLGMSFYYWGLKRTKARVAALGEMFFPFCALGLNWFFLDATLNFTQVLGACLLLVGSSLIQLRHY